MRHPDIDDPDMSLDELMTLWPATINIFLRYKMLCIGCMVSPFHTVIDACLEYNLEEAAFRDELHTAVDA